MFLNLIVGLSTSAIAVVVPQTPARARLIKNRHDNEGKFEFQRKLKITGEYDVAVGEAAGTATVLAL